MDRESSPSRLSGQGWRAGNVPAYVASQQSILPLTPRHRTTLRCDARLSAVSRAPPETRLHSLASQQAPELANCLFADRTSGLFGEEWLSLAFFDDLEEVLKIPISTSTELIFRFELFYQWLVLVWYSWFCFTCIYFDRTRTVMLSHYNYDNLNLSLFPKHAYLCCLLVWVWTWIDPQNLYQGSGSLLMSAWIAHFV